MNVNKALRITRAAGVRLDFDRDAFKWEIADTRNNKTRFDSGLFARMTEDQLREACSTMKKGFI